MVSLYLDFPTRVCRHLTIDGCMQGEQERLLLERGQRQAEYQKAKARLEGVNKRLKDLNIK